MEVADFLRLYTVRAPNIMWFLGAGASAAAGAPTAYDMIWDFKRTLYCAAQRVSVQACSDLGNAELRAKLQRYFDSQERFPVENADDEYSSYFETTYPNVSDRRIYIDRIIAGASPSYGHVALGALLKLDKARAIWTTNFDRVIEDAAIPLLGGSGKLVTASLDNPQIALQSMNEGRWPLLVKIHGDFQSRRLMNTSHELLTQDAALRRALVEGCKRFGLAVVGYSGRDESIMDALEEAIDDGNGFPFGLYWFYRSQSHCLPRVSDLIAKAADRGIEAQLVPIETFDELLDGLLLLQTAIPEAIAKQLDVRKPRVSDAVVPSQGVKKNWPIIRLNALPIVEAPAVCRRVVCDIGGTKDVREAIARADADVIAARRQVGVICFGSDAEVRRSFANNGITTFDLHAIEPARLRYESAEHGLLYEALCRSLERDRPLKVQHRRAASLLIIDSARKNDAIFSRLRKATQNMSGNLPISKLSWLEAARIRLEYRIDRLWLLLEPTIWVESTEDDGAYLEGRDFVRERLAKRYNSIMNEIIDAWAEIVVGDVKECELRAFGIGDGVDAVFKVSRVTAFSWRGA